jgi:Glycosyl transferases group 1
MGDGHAADRIVAIIGKKVSLMRESRIRLLVLYANYTDQMSYFGDWSDALREHRGFDTTLVNIIPSGARDRIGSALGEVDAVVLLHSTNGDSTFHLQRHVPALAERRVPLLSFVGNELNLPGKSIATKRQLLKQIGPEWIASQLLEEAGRYLFGDLPSRGVVSIPHALNPSAFRPKGDTGGRPVDIGARVMRYPPHIGDDDRNRIAQRFIQLGHERGIRVDISHQRHDRPGWANFLNRCKGTVSTEAGSWFLERDDATVNAIRRRTREQVGGVEISDDSMLLKLAYRLPASLRKLAARLYGAAGGHFEYQTVAEEVIPYETIHAQYFAGKPKAPVYGKCISSRHFDAVGTKTCQIMFRGRFNDILEAERHYLALDSDFANLDEVLRQFGDAAERRIIVETAHAHVMEAHTYAHRVQKIETILRQT